MQFVLLKPRLLLGQRLLGEFGGDELVYQLLVLLGRDHVRGTVDEGTHLDLYFVYVDISVDRGLGLEGEKVLDIDVALHLAPEIEVLASETAVDLGLRADNDLTLGVDFTFDLSVDADVAVGGDFSLDDSAD